MPDRPADDAELVRVWITGRNWKVLEVRAVVSGDSKTDAINRAIGVYDRVEQVRDRGGWRAWLLRKAGVNYQ